MQWTQLAYNAEDTTTFGMLDDSDNVVRITVPTEQARGFEMELGRLLSVCADQHESLADVVFALKDKFTIVDLVWPTIPSEQEEVPADSPERPKIQRRVSWAMKTLVLMSIPMVKTRMIHHQLNKQHPCCSKCDMMKSVLLLVKPMLMPERPKHTLEGRSGSSASNSGCEA